MPEHAEAVDLFAGPGGWDVAATEFGVEPLGIEWDEAACATREAAGHRTLKADVAALDPLDFGPCDLVIGSPPCPTFSRAGNGAGRDDMAHVVACSQELAQGIDRREAHTEACKDARSMLVVEPLRWALALRPRAVTLEQVPDVLPYWKMVGDLLAEVGYSWWAGVLEAERYGVPQTRERAILIARRDGQPAHPPGPTHHRYVKGAEREPMAALFDGLLPWVSMADALGWARDTTVNTRGARKTSGGNEFSAARPSWALTEKIRSWHYRAGTQPNQAVRALDEPAPTVGAFGHDVAGAGWVNGNGHVRVSVQEAALLQTFPADYPWQGSRTKQFQQVSNAIPPTLARAILRTIIAA